LDHLSRGGQNAARRVQPDHDKFGRLDARFAEYPAQVHAGGDPDRAFDIDGENRVRFGRIGSRAAEEDSAERNDGA